MFWQNQQLSKFVTSHRNIAANLKLLFLLLLLSRKLYQIETSWNISAHYEKHFLYVFEQDEHLNTARGYNYYLTKFHGKWVMVDKTYWKMYRNSCANTHLKTSQIWKWNGLEYKTNKQTNKTEYLNSGIFLLKSFLWNKKILNL